MRPGDLVAVFWTDCTVAVGSAWHDMDELDFELPVITTLGCVHEVTRNRVTLYSSWCDERADSRKGGVVTIPRAVIKRVIPLELDGS